MHSIRYFLLGTPETMHSQVKQRSEHSSHYSKTKLNLSTLALVTLDKGFYNNMENQYNFHIKIKWTNVYLPQIKKKKKILNNQQHLNILVPTENQCKKAKDTHSCEQRRMSHIEEQNVRIEPRAKNSEF